MAIQRALWRPHFRALPPWPCPTCGGGGKLTPLEDTMMVKETGPSKSEHGEDYWDPEYITKRFSSLLECNNPKCKEIVTVSGNKDLIENFYYDEEGQTVFDYTERFWPISLNPAPHIFEIPPKCPDSTAEAIKSGFALFWIDKDACGTKWRLAIEELLTELKVSRYRKRVKGKPLQVRPLQDRINSFRLMNLEAAECLEAVKWLGNHGTHAGSSLKDDDILKAAEILEHALDLIFVDRQGPVKAARKINKKKGPA